jgi:hypothetical protein
MRARWICSVMCLIVGALCLAAPPAASQALANQVMGLYPQRTGEIIFVDLRALRSSPHYAQIKTQALPQQFRSIEQWINALGMDFERQVQQLSWAFVPAAEGGAVELIGVAEGAFALAEVEQNARRLKLGIARPGGALLVNIGRMEGGGEFVFAFLDASTAVFGWRNQAEEIVTRRAQGGQSLLNNTVMQGVMRELNGRAPMWVALDKKFSELALKQLLPGASQVPGFDNVAAGLQSAWLRFELRDGLRGLASLKCKDSSDALLFSSAAQAAIAYQALALNNQNPDLSRALQQMRVDRQNENLNIEWNLAEPELVALLQKNSFTLNF